MTARLADAVQLFHRPHDVGQMLDDIAAENAVEPTVGDWPGESFQIMDDIDPGERTVVDAGGCFRSADFVAADIEDLKRHSGPMVNCLPQIVKIATSRKLQATSKPELQAASFG